MTIRSRLPFHHASSVRTLNGVCALMIATAVLALAGADIQIYQVNP